MASIAVEGTVAESACERVMVECGVCGLMFDASARSARDYRAGRAEPRCMLHRKRRPRSSRTSIAVYRRWWLDRFSVEEIVEIGTAIWPRQSQRVAGLVASGEGDPDRAVG